MEDLANHTRLELCGNYSNVMAEALTEETTGELLSSEITRIQVPTTCVVGLGRQQEYGARYGAMRDRAFIRHHVASENRNMGIMDLNRLCLV